MKSLFHINTFDGYKRAQGNLKNILKFKDVSDVVVVINGEAIQLVLEPFNFIDGIVYQVCQNSLNAHSIDATQIDKRFVVVASGVYQLTKLQTKGYSYIKP